MSDIVINYNKPYFLKVSFIKKKIMETIYFGMNYQGRHLGKDEKLTK